MKKLLIFDLDGTLLNTLEDLTNAVNYGLNYYNYPSKDLEYVRKAIGNGVQILISRCLPNGFENPDYEKVLDKFKNHYSEHYYENTYPYENMGKTLSKLKDFGYKLAVVTNKVDFIAKDIISHFYPGIFDVVIGDQEGLRKKPYPDMVNKAKSMFGFKDEEITYIGDTNVDYETAKNSNIDILLVTYGFRTRDEMKEYHLEADKVDTVEQIFEYFAK